jgi:effector-binding domain-containing protein
VIKAREIEQSGPPFTLYADEEYTPDDMTLVAGIGCDGELADLPDGIKLREFGGGRSVVTTYRGPYEALPQAWQEAWSWLTEHGHVGRGPGYEVYRVSFAETSNPDEFETDIIVPID